MSSVDMTIKLRREKPPSSFFLVTPILTIMILILIVILILLRPRSRTHKVLKLRPQCLDGGKLVADLIIPQPYQRIDQFEKKDKSKTRIHTAIMVSRLRFNRLMFWRTFSIPCNCGPMG